MKRSIEHSSRSYEVGTKCSRFELDYPRFARKKRKQHQLATSDKIGIIYDAVVKKEKHEEIAAKYNISSLLVCRLQGKAVKEDYLGQLQDADTARALKIQRVIDSTNGLLKRNITINNIEMVQKDLKERHCQKLSKTYLRQILRCEMGMKFRKVKKIPK